LTAKIQSRFLGCDRQTQFAGIATKPARATLRQFGRWGLMIRRLFFRRCAARKYAGDYF
jgi:hypothetical protein